LIRSALLFGVPQDRAFSLLFVKSAEQRETVDDCGNVFGFADLLLIFVNKVLASVLKLPRSAYEPSKFRRNSTPDLGCCIL